MNAQNYLGNLSFLSLFASMIFYWVGLLFDDLKLSPKESNSALFTESVNTSSNLQGKKTTANRFSRLGRYGIILSNVLLGLLLVVRWKESGHFPLSNLYESLMFLSWSFTVLHLFFFKENNETSGTDQNQLVSVNSTPGTTTTAGALNKTTFSLSDKLLGAITTPSALFTNAFATFTLPKEMQEASPLVPALQSNWLMMHVTVMILSYAALILGSLLALAFLILTNSNKEVSQNQKEDKKEGKKMKLAFILDNLSYRILGIGFPFLTIGILSGAVWANEAWGSYWSWDPKETWALLTWLIFAIYLHTRLNKGWEGQKPAMIASFGFVIVWVCYLGVNLIGEGLHSYGWIDQVKST